MNYDYLEQDYIDDVIAENLHAREQEHFHYDLDMRNFQYILSHTNDPDIIKDMGERIAAITKSIYIVDKVYQALLSQIVDPVRHELAVKRCAEKRLLLTNSVVKK